MRWEKVAGWVMRQSEKHQSGMKQPHGDPASPHHIVILSPWRRICPRVNNSTPQRDPPVDLGMSLVEHIGLTR